MIRKRRMKVRKRPYTQAYLEKLSPEEFTKLFREYAHNHFVNFKPNRKSLKENPELKNLIRRMQEYRDVPYDNMLNEVYRHYMNE